MLLSSRRNVGIVVKRLVTALTNLRKFCFKDYKKNPLSPALQVMGDHSGRWANERGGEMVVIGRTTAISNQSVG